ncbi:MAG: SMI1/KNR4 family protein [Propionibacteriaceae bacterium]|jgi:hypothetical protein|nr:SMI1/KNR4 family protein [Propionibacteriaceae bacterium]
MDIFEAYAQINQWIAESSGKLIDIGLDEKYGFTRFRLFSESDLQAFEESTNLLLPEQYREFLKNVGSSNLFGWRGASGIDILSPFDIEELSKDFLGGGYELYPDLLVVVLYHWLEYFGGFLRTISGLADYSMFFLDVPPEGWLEEAVFVEFNEWIIMLVEHKAMKVTTWCVND